MLVSDVKDVGVGRAECDIIGITVLVTVACSGGISFCCNVRSLVGNDVANSVGELVGFDAGIFVGDHVGLVVGEAKGEFVG